MTTIDGLDVLRAQFSLKDIASLIASTAMWVDRDTFHYLPVWYPEEGRRDLMYKSNWSEPQYNTSRSNGQKTQKVVGNVNANKALTTALGRTKKSRPNWTCCHIWSVDDPSFQISNNIVSNKKYYSCVGNMVLLPTPLKAFTDAMPEIKTMLRVSAAAYYGWSVQHRDVPGIEEEREKCSWTNYPISWPRSGQDQPPLGVVEFNRKIQASADRRLRRIASDLESAGEHYPRQEVLDSLKHWAGAITEFEKLLSAKGFRL